MNASLSKGQSTAKQSSAFQIQPVKNHIAHCGRFLMMVVLLLTLLGTPASDGQRAPQIALASPQMQQIDLVAPPGSVEFGYTVTVLANGNLVITDPFYSTVGSDYLGAVHLYDGQTGAHISTITGSTAMDRVSLGGIYPLSNGNFVIYSQTWHYNTAEAGAVTWCSGTTGCSGVVSPTNSLIPQYYSVEVTPLTNGNYVVSCGGCTVNSVVNAGSATWADGTTGISGFVTPENSLVGDQENDAVGSAVALPNGNYVVSSRSWSNEAVSRAGAATWCDGATGCTGYITPTNSLVGSTANDGIGATITVLPNGNYVVMSMLWDNGGAVDAGAATWCSAVSGCTGVVSASNSLVGENTGDNVGYGNVGLVPLADSDYVVISPNWENYGLAEHAGAVTWCSGTSGCTGVVSAANSLVGDWDEDKVGSTSVIPLIDGDYVVNSAAWERYHNIGINNYNHGASTWCSGTGGCVGNVSESNSLVGSQPYDAVGVGATALTNGSYVVQSYNWKNGDLTRAGAVTWCSGSGGCTGEITPANSLVGDHAYDYVGNPLVVALTNGNYVVASLTYQNGGVSGSGAITWGSGSGGLVGEISASNSLLGATSNESYDRKVFALSNGNYVVTSMSWDNGTAADAGAVTWCDGDSGCSGLISPSNSLVGTTAGDAIGLLGVQLANGNFVTGSLWWDNGSAINAGAVTWMDGDTGLTGPVSTANSLVGTTTEDEISSNALLALANGNYVVSSSNWDGAGVTNAGAVTWGNGTTGTVGSVSAANSLVGSTAEDCVGGGSTTALENGKFIVRSEAWDNGVIYNAQAVTLGSGTEPLTGPITAANSVLGMQGTAADDTYYRYNTVYDYMVVARTREQIVSLFPGVPDIEPPSPPTLLSPADEATIADTTPTLTWQASTSPDVDGYLLDLDGEITGMGNVTQYTTPELANGEHTWRVLAYDLSGNNGEYSETWTFTVEGFTPGPVMYVNGSSGVDSGDCRNPLTPCDTVSYALSQAQAGDSILVTTGIYYEYLVINQPVTIRGGYAQAGETWTAQSGETTIDGMHLDTVITLESGASGTLLEALTITNGYGVMVGGVDALNASLTIQSCTIRDNVGYNSESAIGGGGVVGAVGSNTLTILNSRILRNQINQGASGVRAHSGTLSMVNTLVANNSGDWGLHVNGATDFNFVTITYNQGGVLFNAGEVQHEIKNSILWSNMTDVSNPGLGTLTISYSDVGGGYAGVGNIDLDPLFIDPVSQDYHLQPGSQCINAAGPLGVTATDLDGKLRDALPDMGAYEWTNLKFLLSLVKKAGTP